MVNDLITKNESTVPAKLVYVLYLVGILVGITSIIGLVIAYFYRSDASDWLKTHYRYQIRTFWVSLVYAILAFVLAFILVGYLVYVFLLVWIIVRCVKGLKTINKNVPISNPATWLF